MNLRQRPALIATALAAAAFPLVAGAAYASPAPDEMTPYVPPGIEEPPWVEEPPLVQNICQVHPELCDGLEIPIPDDSDEPDTPDDSDEPDSPDTPDEPDEPDSPDPPDEPDEPDSPDEPEQPEQPEETTPTVPPANPDKPVYQAPNFTG
jgi:hypothetical protein